MGGDDGWIACHPFINLRLFCIYWMYLKLMNVLLAYAYHFFFCGFYIDLIYCKITYLCESL